ncbi:hypothetical protein [Streptomyces sp. B6B3]|uniref:hypothetical protein n=1 Tax=Streptomyces sp. B6B3 TaxID=3153570 RepID=UPI00325E4D02
MLTHLANGESRTSFWPRVREFAVPAAMIETATARRRAGDWAGACAAAAVDVDLNLRFVANRHGRELAARVRADLRRLAPDLLRWHLPRIAPDGLLRPGLTLSLARYGGLGPDRAGAVHLVVRTPPAWANAGQRISLAVWDGSRAGTGACRPPHPRPHRRYRLDLHRHLWDADRSGELRSRSGADPSSSEPAAAERVDPEAWGIPPGLPCAVDRWAAEAGILLATEGRDAGRVVVWLGAGRRLVLHVVNAPTAPRIAAVARRGATSAALPVLPDAATWMPPDLDLVRRGAIGPGRLHPLVAAALVPGHAPDAGSPRPDPAGGPRIVECRGAAHRIGVVDGVLVPLDHDPDELRREELLVALTGTPLPCLRVIDEAHRRPDCLPDVRERLHHGDVAGALAVVEGLLGPDAVLRHGALRDELAEAARRRVAYGLFRAGLVEPGVTPGEPPSTRHRHRRARRRRTPLTR